MSYGLKKEDDPILRQKALPVEEEEEAMEHAREVAEEMSRVRQENNGIGLAAPQIGEPLRIINAVLRGREYTIINPYIKHRKGAVKVQESCLSLGNKVYEVKRPQRLTLYGEDIHGRPLKFRCRDVHETSVVEHEVDHLDGILIDEKGTYCGTRAMDEKEKVAFG